ncbi:protein Skeletor, isoforms B/C-like [Amblyomma americanum]
MYFPPFSQGHRLLAGVVLDARNKVDVSKGTGRYCEWTHKTVDKSDESSTWEDFKQSLNLQCDVGQPGTFTWTLDKDTPDVVYYQCFTHYYLGWKIMVTDPDQPERGRGKDRMESGRGEDRMESGAGPTTALLPLLLLGVIVSKAA